MEAYLVEQYETFVGQNFHHKDDVDLLYTIGPIDDGKGTVMTEDTDTVPYEVDEILTLLRNQVWILEN